MRRRKALKYASAILGGSISSSLALGVLSGCRPDSTLDWTPKVLTPDEVLVVADLMECIYPATDTPGAKEAEVERFVDSMLAEFLMEPEKVVFMNGIRELARKDFSSRPLSEQREMVQILADEARNRMPQQSDSSRSFFRLAKELATVGFFTSEVGASQVLQYDAIPGGFQGCRDLDQVGSRTWAT